MEYGRGFRQPTVCKMVLKVQGVFTSKMKITIIIQINKSFGITIINGQNADADIAHTHILCFILSVQT